MSVVIQYNLCNLHGLKTSSKVLHPKVNTNKKEIKIFPMLFGKKKVTVGIGISLAKFKFNFHNLNRLQL